MSQMCIVEVESTINGDEDIHRRRYSYSSRRIAHFGPFSRSIRVPQSTNNIKTQKKHRNGVYQGEIPSLASCAVAMSIVCHRFVEQTLSYIPGHSSQTALFTPFSQTTTIPPPPHASSLYTTTTTTTTHNTPLCSIPPPLHSDSTQCLSYNKSVFLTSSRLSCRKLQLVTGRGPGLFGCF